eukprot:1397310-Amphidinium_carterae.1
MKPYMYAEAFCKAWILDGTTNPIDSGSTSHDCRLEVMLIATMMTVQNWVNQRHTKMYNRPMRWRQGMWSPQKPEAYVVETWSQPIAHLKRCFHKADHELGANSPDLLCGMNTNLRRCLNMPRTQ